MDYQKARQVRKSGLLSLINEGLFEDDKSFKGAIGGAISDKFKAKSLGIKESLDPLNWARKLAGKGALGDFAVSGLGRLTGRKNKDIEAFGGFARKNQLKNKKDPQFTTISPGPIKPLKTGDSVSDILGKMYNFMLKADQVRKLNDEIEKTFRIEQLDEDERRHKALVAAIRKFTGKGGKGDTGDDKESRGPGLLGGLGIAGIVDALWNMGKHGITQLGTWASKLIKGVGSAVKGILPKSFEKISKVKLPFVKEKIGGLPPKEKIGGSKDSKKPATRGSQSTKDRLKANRTSRSVPMRETPKSLTRVQKAVAAVKSTAVKATTAVAKNPVTKTAFKVSKSALRGAGKLLSFLASIPGLNTIFASGIAAIEIKEAMKAHEDGKISEQEMHKAIVKIVGGAIGSVAGGTIGATVGAAIGGPVGLVVGGIAGSLYVGAKGEDAGELLYDYFAGQHQLSQEEIDKATANAVKFRQEHPEAMHGIRSQAKKNEGITKTSAPEWLKDAKGQFNSFDEQLNKLNTPVPKSSTIPQVQTPLGTGNQGSPKVAVNNTTNTFGGKSPKVIQTTSAKMRDSSTQYQLKNIAVVV